MEEQQFGQWIRATQFNQLKKTTVEVQGFEEYAQRSKATSNRIMAKTKSLKGASPVNSDQKRTQSAAGLSVVTSENGTTAVTGVIKSNPAIPNFEEVLRDIDDSINAFSGLSNSDLNKPNLHEERKEWMTLLDVPMLQAKNSLVLTGRLRENGGKDNHNELISVGCFHVGWTAGDGDKKEKGRKNVGVRSNDKIRGKNKIYPKEDVTSQIISDKPSGPKKGTWSRIL